MTSTISIAARPAARLVFDAAGAPRDPGTHEVYHAGDGLTESRHVFLGGIGAPAIWQHRRAVGIGEFGFGTGLNFLATWCAWRETKPHDAARLDYVAIEDFPLAGRDLARAHAAFPELAADAAALRAAWPPPVGGFHRLWLDDGRVALTLVFAEAEAALAALSRPLDAWYLAGVASDRTPGIWTERVFREVARLSRPGAPLATFTAAGAVRRGLESAGFEVERAPGPDGKRHCLRARFRGVAGVEADAPPAASAAVVGAGVAGLTVARALRRRGFEVRIFDREGPGAEASGIPAAMIAPRLQRTPSLRRSFNAQAYLHALRFYESFPAAWSGRGALTLARDDADAAAQARLVEELGWPGELMALCTPAEAARRLGTAVRRGGLLHPGAGTLDGRRLMTALAAPLEIERAAVAGIAAAADGWRLLDAAGGEIARATRLVVAAGPWSAALLGDAAAAPPLRANRGQASLFAGGAGPAIGVTFGGYLAPAGDRRGHVLGATFERLPGPEGDAWRPPKPADDEANIGKLAAHLPALAAGLGRPAGAWAGLRATTPDYLPYAGELAPGLHLLAGLGARGFQAAPLLAELLADEIAGAPPPLPAAVRTALDPCRFGGPDAVVKGE